MRKEISKSTRYLAIACCFSGINGCASDGGLGELATYGALAGSMIPGGDSGTVAALGTVAVATMVVAPVLSDDSETDSSPTSPSSSSEDALMRNLIDRETPDRYRPRNCEYIEVSLDNAAGNISSTNSQAKQLGEAQKVAASQIWLEKGCTKANFPWGTIGVHMETIDPHKAALYSMPTSGIWIARVEAGSPAQQAGLLANDLVVAVNDQPVVDAMDFRVQVGKAPIGSTLNFKVWRYQAFQTVPVVVGASVRLPVGTPAAAKAMVSASTSILQGMTLGTVTSSYAKAVGLPSAQGAWVIDTVKGSAAEKAGIKALDVIVEIGGQEVASAQDVAEISSRMRAGYKATVIVWRNQIKRDVQMVMKNE